MYSLGKDFVDRLVSVYLNMVLLLICCIYACFVLMIIENYLLNQNNLFLNAV